MENKPYYFKINLKVVFVCIMILTTLLCGFLIHISKYVSIPKTYYNVNNVVYIKEIKNSDIKYKLYEADNGFMENWFSIISDDKVGSDFAEYILNHKQDLPVIATKYDYDNYEYKILYDGGSTQNFNLVDVKTNNTINYLEKKNFYNNN